MSPLTRRLQARSTRLAWYSSVSAITCLMAVLWLRAWALDPSGMFSGGGDLFFALATAQSHGDSGVFGETSHLAWPTGYSGWSVPQFGVLFGTISWILVGVIGVSAVAAVYAFWILSTSVNAVCIFFFFRSLRIPGANLASAALAISLSVGAFTQTRFLHPNVVAFFIVPLVFGVIVRLSRGWSGNGRWVFLALVFSAGFVSGLWWVIVICLIVPVTTAIQLLQQRWNLFRDQALVFLTLTLACLGQLIVYRLHRVLGLAESRSPWDSNLFGGHFVDLLLASPAINLLLPHLTELSDGASLGNSLVGTVPTLGALTALIITVTGVPRGTKGPRVLLLRDFTIVSIFFFVLGGLGNLQAGLAILIGVPSPARAWSRLIIVLAILGLGWVLLLLFRPALQLHTKIITSLVVGFCLITWVLDSSLVPRPNLLPIQDRPEYAAVSFLRSSLGPCPIAQLPRDGFPLVRVDSQAYHESGLGNRGFVPYLIAPEFSWTFASWTPQTQDVLASIGPSVSADEFGMLRDSGFCALLFDKDLSIAAQDVGAPLEGSRVETSQEPDFRSNSYDVYILRPLDTPSNGNSGHVEKH